MGVTLAEGHEVIQATQDVEEDFVADPKGYFLIRLKRETQEIEVGFCSEPNIVELTVVGKEPKAIYETLLRKKLVSRLEHAAYLGKELHKAYTALRLNLNYIQDDELVLK